METVLLVMSDSLRTRELQQALRYANLNCNLVSNGGLFALTLLEREAPAVLVCAGDLGDMSGHDLYEIIRADGLHDELISITLDAPISDMINQYNVQLECDIPVPQIVRLISKLLSAHSNTPSGFTGSLESLSMFDLVMLLIQTRKSGLLLLRLDPFLGRILLHDGRITHAEYDCLEGEKALTRIFMDAEHAPDTAFAFHAQSDPIISPSLWNKTSIHSASDHLLLNVAINLDQLGMQRLV